GMYTHEGSDP
nr:RecName: Full=Aminopeptidase N; Short=AP-N; AltName: Full=CryIA(C) receptor [Helicoverpa armigera]